MALSEVYVDPSIAADSGTGTLGDPFGDLEYAIEQTTFDTTNGTRVNVKAGTDEVLAAPIQTAMADTSVSVAWVPSETAPLVIQGYTSVAGDGGIGGISGGGSVGIISGTSHVFLFDLHLHNVGNNQIVALFDWCGIARCEFDTTTVSDFAVEVRNYSTVRDCYIHDCNSSSGLGLSTFSTAAIGNYIDWTGSTYGLLCGGYVAHNIVVSRITSSVGIRLSQDAAFCANNSVYCTLANTNAGIQAAAAAHPLGVMNNLVEGWSGAGGVGIEVNLPTHVPYYGGNAVYNCTTSFADPTNDPSAYGDNEVLTASPFNDAANGDFSPVDVGNVIEGALPNVIGGGFV